MTITLSPSKIEGTITAPPSKSITHRAIILAALSDGTSVLKQPLLSDDTRITMQALSLMGIGIRQENNTLIILGGRERLKAPKEIVHLGESGTSLRLLIGVASLIKGKTIFTGAKRLFERPIADLMHALKQMGVTIIKGADMITVESKGAILGGTIRLNAEKSSQFLSSLLLIAPFAQKDVFLVIKSLRSQPYVRMTIALMNEFGVTITRDYTLSEVYVKSGQRFTPKDYTIEGDYSSTSYLLAAAIITEGEITVTNLKKESQQGDKYFLEILREMGCNVTAEQDAVRVTRKKQLKAVRCDMGNYPDLVQTVSVIAATAHGETVLTNIAHLRFKESNRLENTVTELRRFGINATAENSSLRIQGGEPIGARVTTYNDHRMAMAFSILGLKAKGKTTIMHAEVVSKSYPVFFADLQSLGAKMKEAS